MSVRSVIHCGRGDVTVCHAIPAYRGFVSTDVAQSCARDAYALAQLGMRYVSVSIDLGRIDVARNMAVKAARDMKADFLYMQDSDTWGVGEVPTLPLLLKSLAETGAAVFCATVRTRDGTNFNSVPVGKRLNADAPTELRYGGAALMLIDMRALEKLALPWFEFVSTPDGLWTVGPEDMYFCELVRRRGGKIFTDVRIQTSHAGEAVHVFDKQQLPTGEIGADPTVAKALELAVSKRVSGRGSTPLAFGRAARW